ncbi:MAG: trypsin-like peptidase domain-containing protein [Alphaproteobacteria bacterium]|nr:trypsin-like peptidase domain-containing protein [Alphaproteobacteria bacterium]MBU2041143.1 trypsin-like peptidase domain-containing protein [Alphaproteobacteria bacterium]MBU2124902.1 trypsin-like peptidase domain-containing protein [Alphaproteobacteria bacterium]MBU2209459.1 trypsin-like peptidase domain-containing protein [Alphaproteobacteria bacterium]MBU2292388.1 trypsin-like peptidase domain-containing protein [Alphaproteobacteria bacterium]
MKSRSLAIALALTLAACGQPNDTRAQDGVFSENRVVPGDALAMKASFAPVVRTAAPAVVNISARGVQQVRDPFWGIPGQRQTGSVGSGVIVRPNGVVVTNNHVIQGMQQIRVTLNDRREFNARVVLADERSDIAVLQLEGVNERLPVLNIDDAEEQQIGDLVLAIGNPFGVGQTVTNGIISALNRTETGISDSGSFIQTDAAINPGNSGGALVDMDGDLIGINTAIFSRSGSSSGVGFAVPASMVKRVVDSAVGGATAVVRPWLGVKGDTVSAEIARSLDIDRPQGLVVTEVWPNGPGARAGLREGDIITAIDGAEVNDQGGLNFRVGTRAPNETVEIAVLRDGRSQTLTARVQPLPGDVSTDNATLLQSGVLSGAQVLALNPALADSLGGDPFATGVIVGRVQRGSYANRVGVQGGDIILTVNGRAVTSVQQLADVGRGSELTINRRGQRISGVIR